jgi:polyhydroxyalkanoate synthesis regulator phasin|tara:strand:+ start:509 stop:904 length:396 start_codon:yes stop_codon:yes gene_type:complete
MAKMLTLGQAAKMTGKSKPTISKAVKDGRISGKKGKDGVFQIEVSELLRVYPAKSEEKSDPLVLTKDMGNAVVELEKKFLEEKLQDMERRMMKLEQERDQAVQDAREDRAKFMALLEDKRPRGFWGRLTGK